MAVGLAAGAVDHARSVHRLRVDLPLQIDIDGAVNRVHTVVRRHHLRVEHEGRGVQLAAWILGDEFEVLGRAARPARCHRHPRTKQLVLVRHLPFADELRPPRDDHLRVQSESLLPVERPTPHERAARLAHPDLQVRPVRHYLRHVRRNRQRVGVRLRPLPQQGRDHRRVELLEEPETAPQQSPQPAVRHGVHQVQQPLPLPVILHRLHLRANLLGARPELSLDQVVDLGDVHGAVAVEHGKRVVDLGDHRAAVLHVAALVEHHRPEVDVPLLVRTAHPREEHIREEAVVGPLDLLHLRREQVGDVRGHLRVRRETARSPR